MCTHMRTHAHIIPSPPCHVLARTARVLLLAEIHTQRVALRELWIGASRVILSGNNNTIRPVCFTSSLLLAFFNVFVTLNTFLSLATSVTLLWPSALYTRARAPGINRHAVAHKLFNTSATTHVLPEYFL